MSYVIGIQKNYNQGGIMDTFKGLSISYSYKPDVIRNWNNSDTKKVDDIFGPYKMYQLNMLHSQEAYLEGMDIPFITTNDSNGYRIWKEKKAEHVR